MISFITRHKVIISIAAFSIIYLYTLDNYWKPFWDSAIYISLGKSIAAGNGYYYMGLPHAKYPFILPLMLSPIIGLFGLNFLLMRLLIIIFAIGSIYLTYILFKKVTDEGTAFSIMILTGFSSILLHSSTWILSEIPYMFFSLCAIYSITSYSKERKCLARAGLLTSLFLMTAIFTRVMGISLLIAFLCHSLSNKNTKGYFLLDLKKVMLVGIIVSLPLCLWFYRSHLINKSIPFQPEYRGVLNYEREFFLEVPDNTHSETLSLGDFVKRSKNNLRIYVCGTSNIIIEKVPLKNLRPFIVLFFLYGYCWCFIKRRTIIEYYLCFYLILCITWWFNQQPQRFLTPVIPFIFYYFLIGLKRGMELLLKLAVKIEKNKVNMAKKVIWGMLVTLLISVNFPFKPSLIKNERRKQFHPPALISEFFSAINWINNYTAPDSIIMSARTPWVFMLTNRKTLTWPLFEPLPNIITSVLQNGVDYIVVSSIHQETYHLLHNFVESYPGQFCKVFCNNKTSIYKIERTSLSTLDKKMDKNL